jgi:hypothetical protein
MRHDRLDLLDAVRHDDRRRRVVIPVGVLEGVAELAQVLVRGQDLGGAQHGGEASTAREKSASETPGGSGLVETASAWLMTLSSQGT